MRFPIVVVLGLLSVMSLPKFGFAQGTPNMIPLNVVPSCIKDPPSGTERCPVIDEVFCSADCPTTGALCYVLGSTTQMTAEEWVQLNSGAATEINTYDSCRVGDPGCKKPNVTDTINCYSVRDCSCVATEDGRKCELGTQTLFYLNKYKPHTLDCVRVPNDPPNDND